MNNIAKAFSKAIRAIKVRPASSRVEFTLEDGSTAATFIDCDGNVTVTEGSCTKKYRRAEQVAREFCSLVMGLNPGTYLVN